MAIETILFPKSLSAAATLEGPQMDECIGSKEFGKLGAILRLIQKESPTLQETAL